ncbi:MAG TPA: hypothetical protein VFJ14_15980 [Nocardioidaceae bacterium]|nr:hypothetical protein [Nocardioidaceae bacterium]
MSQPPSPPEQPKSPGDPWHAFSYLVTGVGFYGVAGWLLDRWLETSFLLPTGIIVGAALGLFLTYKRFQPHDHG